MPTEHQDDPAAILQVDTASPIFIGGQRCSGIRQLGSLLDRYTGIACGPALKFPQRTAFLEWHQTLTTEWSDRIEKFGFERDVLDRSFAALIDNLLTRAQRGKGKSRWAERTGSNIARIDYMFTLFPHAQFVHMIRDPREVMAVIKQRAATTKPAWSKLTAESVTSEWLACVAAGEPWRQRPDRYIEIHFEEFVTDGEATLQRVLTFLNEAPIVDRPDPFPWSVDAVHTPLLREERLAIETAAGEVMRQMGY